MKKLWISKKNKKHKKRPKKNKDKKEKSEVPGRGFEPLTFQPEV